jgi:hypothetical protein
MSRYVERTLDKPDLTSVVNQTNVEAVRRMIEMKKGGKPFYANSESVTGILTDMDSFPYTRFWRGVPYFPDPIAMEREGGWRMRRDKCYEINVPVLNRPPPNNCFETACSTVFPCYPKSVSRFSDQSAILVMNNDACVLQYR